MIAQKPKTLNFIEAASAPVVTVTAWQMLFDYAEVTAGQTVLIHWSGWLSLIRLEEIRSSGRFEF
jgi:NADPH:quinone reductase-like Zn-dependent oxidoreductase